MRKRFLPGSLLYSGWACGVAALLEFARTVVYADASTRPVSGIHSGIRDAPSPRRSGLILAAMAILAGMVLLLAPGWGMRWIGPDAVGTERDILLHIRLPRVLVAFMAGAGLSVCGLAFQAMFRSPLATPFTLGVAGGASFGATLAVLAAAVFPWAAGMPLAEPAAMLGAMAAILLVYGLSRVRRTFSVSILLLAGLVVNYFFAGLTVLVQSLADWTDAFRMLHVLIGGLDGVDADAAIRMAWLVIPGTLWLAGMPDELNLMTLGDDLAESRGMSPNRVRRRIFFGASLTVGGIVSVCGPIGFVGLMAPHLCRLLLGGDHRFLMPASILAGGILLTLCDGVARVALAPVEIPVGVVTALLGGPFFLSLLLFAHTQKDE